MLSAYIENKYGQRHKTFTEYILKDALKDEKRRFNPPFGPYMDHLTLAISTRSKINPMVPVFCNPNLHITYITTTD